MLHRPLIPLLLAYIGGVVIGQIFLPCFTQLIILLISLIISLLFSSLFLTKKSIKFAVYILVFFLLGTLFQNLHNPQDSYLVQLAKERRAVVIEGTILRFTKIENSLTRFEFRAERLFSNGKQNRIKNKILVTVYNNWTNFMVGERIRFPARLRLFKNFNNPGRYDYEFAMKIRRLVCSASVSDGRRIVSMGRGRISMTMAIRDSFLKPVRSLFRKKLSEENRIFYSALILGERQEISPALRNPFDRTGAGHILAVSGLHIGLIAWFVFSITKLSLSCSYYLTTKTDIRKLAALMTCIPVIGYTFLSGFLISGQRAMIMVLSYLLSIFLGREKETWSTLAFAALCILVIDPNAIFSISFQLSFIAVIGILWIVPLINKRLPDPFAQDDKNMLMARIYQYISGLFIVTLSAVLFLLPVTTFYFNRISIISIPVNLIIVPVLGVCVIPMGLLSSILVHIFPSAADLTIHLGDLGLTCILNIIRFWSQWNYSSFWMFTPNLFEIILFYGFLFCVIHRGKWKWAKIGFALVLIMTMADASFWIKRIYFNRDLKVTYFDVGQGNSALIQFPGSRKMLIDGGGYSQSGFDMGGMVIAPSLWHSKIGKIDFLVLTHPQADHIGGLNFIAANFSPKEFWYNGDQVPTIQYRDLMDTLESRGISILLPRDISIRRDISGVEIRLLHPLSNSRDIPIKNSRQLNNNSLVLKLTFKGKSLLFPGDIESLGEMAVLNNQRFHLKSDVLLSPHHGSRTSSTRSFLEAVSPKICIISTGSSNYFGFPHKETISKLMDIGCEILRTDQIGAVRLTVGEEGIEQWSYLGQKSGGVVSHGDRRS